LGFVVVLFFLHMPFLLGATPSLFLVSIRRMCGIDRRGKIATGLPKKNPWLMGLIIARNIN